MLKQVEKTKAKTKKVIYYYEETRKNKLFYKHKQSDEAKQLAVILQNKKRYE